MHRLALFTSLAAASALIANAAQAAENRNQPKCDFHAFSDAADHWTLTEGSRKRKWLVMNVGDAAILVSSSEVTTAGHPEHEEVIGPGQSTIAAMKHGQPEIRLAPAGTDAPPGSGEGSTSKMELSNETITVNATAEASAATEGQPTAAASATSEPAPAGEGMSGGQSTSEGAAGDTGTPTTTAGDAGTSSGENAGAASTADAGTASGGEPTLPPPASPEGSTMGPKTIVVVCRFFERR